MRMKKIYSITLLAAIFLSCNMAVSAQEVAPMLTTKYSQTGPYNNSCPEKSAAGCGPVAIAQILTKYKQPVHGYGTVSYQSGANKYDVDVDFESYTFDWENIKDDYRGEYTDQQAKAVAHLINNCDSEMYEQYGSSKGVNN